MEMKKEPVARGWNFPYFNINDRIHNATSLKAKCGAFCYISLAPILGYSVINSSVLF